MISLVYLFLCAFVSKLNSLTIPLTIMEKANPPLSPREVALLREQIESEIRELRELNRLINVELDHAFSDLATALYSNKDLGPNDFVSIIERPEEEEMDPRLNDYFNLHPTKEEIAY